jgi:hypothetical protein
MIKIFNRKLQFEISIEEIDQVIFTPRDYDEVPFVKIELKNFDFHRHSKTCKDCGALLMLLVQIPWTGL